MYHFTRHTMLSGALGLAMLLGTAGEVPAVKSSSDVTEEEAIDTDRGAPHDTPWSTSPDGYSCSCVDTYMHGREVPVASCDNADDRCADIDILLDCQEDPDGPDCDYLRQCECNCTALDETVEFEPYDDVVLTGVPDLWQFDFKCNISLELSVGDNAVGCGPVSAAMVMYWWAQQGYERLVDDFLVGDGSGPAEKEHDWQALVRTLREDYLDGGFCVGFGGGQYATPMWTMTTGLRQYIQDAGYRVNVDHWKVCEDCNAGGADEIHGGDALALIKNELQAGRPVIMGFNVGKAQDVQVPIYHDDLTYDMVYVGELSNGAPITGIISHYAVITGYRRMEGLDVLSLNLGFNDGTTDQLFLWNPGGKWMHLYTVDITSKALGTPWCTIDRGVDADEVDAFSQPYVSTSHVESSTPSTTNELTVLAGTSCGIAREGEWVSYYDTTHQLETCVTAGDLPSEEEMADVVGAQTTTVGPRDEGGFTGGGSPILDQELPLP